MSTGTEQLKSPLRSPSSRRPWDLAAVSTDDYLASLTRRLEALEKKLVGRRGVREDFPPLFPAVKVKWARSGAPHTHLTAKAIRGGVKCGPTCPNEEWPTLHIGVVEAPGSNQIVLLLGFECVHGCGTQQLMVSVYARMIYDRAPPTT